MSDTAKIQRSPARRRPTVKAKSRKVTPKGKSTWSKFVAALPFKPRTIEKAITTGMVLLIGGAVIGVMVLAGVPQFVGVQMAQVAGRAGFRVKRVEVTGIDRMERLTVYAIALDQHSMAMPLVDLDKVRNQLMGYGWIEDARVSRRLPDTLVVDIVERKPSAIWQHNQKLTLIDAKGFALERVAANAMPDLPLLIGPDANTQAVGLHNLMERAPAMKPMLAAATWVGNRRWDLRFESGETLALPEGEEAAGKALLRFARIDGVQRLLGRGYARFDMRDSTKLVARLADKQAPIDKPSEGDSKPDVQSSEGGGSGPA
jgi:cell division protein FtsQ